MIKRVRDFDAARPRCLQAERRLVRGRRLPLRARLPAGRRVRHRRHRHVGRAARHRDPRVPGAVLKAVPGVRLEVDTCYRGIPGHADLVEPDAVVDIKTTSLANSKLWAEDHRCCGPSASRSHGYAAGLVDAGELPADCTVRLLVIPVDGTFADWWAYEEPFDRALRRRGAPTGWSGCAPAMAAGETLPKDKPLRLLPRAAASSSPSAATRRGRRRQLAEITDPELAAAVARYGEAEPPLSSRGEGEEPPRPA